jgi:energy-coupling factor transporter ATP-binding protein EcfA2
MELRAYAISVRGPHAPMLNATSVSVGDHQLVLLAGYPGAGHVAAALSLSGRLRPDGGDVKLDGQADGSVLRRRVAVVDAPGITEPDDALPVKLIVGEELAIAGRKAGRKAVHAWLQERGWDGYADTRFEHLPISGRTKFLAELTVARPEVKVVILTMPDRHGGDPHAWYALGRDLASRGYGVIITCADASARLLGVPAAQLGSVDQPDPVKVAPAAPVEPVEPIEETKVEPVEETVEKAAEAKCVVPSDEKKAGA